MLLWHFLLTKLRGGMRKRSRKCMDIKLLTVLRSGKPSKMLGLSPLIITGNSVCLICNLYELMSYGVIDRFMICNLN